MTMICLELNVAFEDVKAIHVSFLCILRSELLSLLLWINCDKK